MDRFILNSTTPTTLNASTTALFCLPSSLCPRRSKTLSFAKKQRKFSVFASKDESKLDQWDQMELKFGRMIGEDPKLTLAKIMGRKSNPDMSYLEIEKSFEKKKGKAVNNIEEVPFEVSERKKSSNSLDGLNLVRPVPKKGVKFEVDNKPKQREQKRPTEPVVKAVENGKVSVPNVILRKPSIYNEDDVGDDRSRLRIKPNLTLQMGRALQKERFTDITLLKKPEPLQIKPDQEEENSQSGNAKAGGVNDTADSNLKDIPVSKGRYADLTLKEKPNASAEQGEQHINEHANPTFLDISMKDASNASTDLLDTAKRDGDQVPGISEEDSGEKNDSVKGLQSSNMQSTGRSSDSNIPSKKMEPKPGISVEAALLGKPQRLDQPVKATSDISRGKVAPVTPESYDNAVELENFLSTSPIKEYEDNDWTRAEDLVKTGEREEVELISSSTRGFVVSFGSLIGFLPYRNLAAKWKFLAFESWLRRKGLDPSKYRQNLGVIGSSEATSKIGSPGSKLDPQIDNKVDKEILPDMKLEELLTIYDQEKLKFLSSFVGQKIKVSVVLADRKSRKLIFSIKPKEKEELLGKKRSLMAKLSVGDVVKCCIKKITYFGIFVEVEGVPALIHQTEVSWDATLDPASYFKIGQIVEAKVHQLDFSLERIFLSLKEITPDPLMEALEAVVGDHDALDGRLEAAQADTEWPEVESLIQELQQFEGIQSVWKGRYFLSPGLAPTFQVYMAAMFKDQYKLLARSGNRVQEVMVQTLLGKEEMKSAILTCTNRVV